MSLVQALYERGVLLAAPITPRAIHLNAAGRVKVDAGSPIDALADARRPEIGAYVSPECERLHNLHPDHPLYTA